MPAREIGIFCPATVGFDPLVGIEFIHDCSTSMRIISWNLCFLVDSPFTRETHEDITQKALHAKSNAYEDSFSMP